MSIQSCSIKSSKGWASGFVENIRDFRLKSVHSNPLKSDPTKTKTLRKRFEQDIGMRFIALKRALIALIVEEDAFGIALNRPFNQEQGDGPLFHRADNRSDGGSLLGDDSHNQTSTKRNGQRNVDKEQKDDEVVQLPQFPIGTSNRDNNRFNSIVGIHSGGSLDRKTLNQQKEQKDVSISQVDSNNSQWDSNSSASRSSSRDSRLSNCNVDIMDGVLNQRFAFQSTTEQLASFEGWIKEQLDGGLINPNDPYWERYVRQGYEKGAGRAFTDTHKARRALAGSGQQMAHFEGTKEQFLQTAFGQTESIEKVKLLASRTLTDLRGVSGSIATRMSRTLVNGLSQGQNPREIARTMTKDLGIDKRRAQTIARTEIIRAHAEGQLDALEGMGVEEVGVMVEWSTAGDDRVCPLCQPLEGVVLKIKEARGILPRHPNCRCSFLPANVGEPKGTTRKVNFGEGTQDIGQTRSKAGVEKAIKTSVSRERVKGTLKEKFRRSTWVGADKARAIAKLRPKSILDTGVAPAVPKKITPKPPAKVPKPVPKVKKATPRIGPEKRLYAKKLGKNREEGYELSQKFSEGLDRSKFGPREMELEAALLDGAQHKIVLSTTERTIRGAVAISDDFTELLTIEHLGATSAVKGTGTELMRKALTLAKQKGKGLQWQSSNEAIGFYKRLGFKMTDSKLQLFEVRPGEVSKLLESLGKPGRTFKPPVRVTTPKPVPKVVPKKVTPKPLVKTKPKVASAEVAQKIFGTGQVNRTAVSKGRFFKGYRSTEAAKDLGEDLISRDKEIMGPIIARSQGLNSPKTVAVKIQHGELSRTATTSELLPDNLHLSANHPSMKYKARGVLPESEFGAVPAKTIEDIRRTSVMDIAIGNGDRGGDLFLSERGKVFLVDYGNASFTYRKELVDRAVDGWSMDRLGGAKAYLKEAKRQRGNLNVEDLISQAVRSGATPANARKMVQSYGQNLDDLIESLTIRLKPVPKLPVKVPKPVPKVKVPKKKIPKPGPSAEELKTIQLQKELAEKEAKRLALEKELAEIKVKADLAEKKLAEAAKKDAADKAEVLRLREELSRKKLTGKELAKEAKTIIESVKVRKAAEKLERARLNKELQDEIIAHGKAAKHADPDAIEKALKKWKSNKMGSPEATEAFEEVIAQRKRYADPAAERAARLVKDEKTRKLLAFENKAKKLAKQKKDAFVDLLKLPKDEQGQLQAVYSGTKKKTAVKKGVDKFNEFIHKDVTGSGQVKVFDTKSGRSFYRHGERGKQLKDSGVRLSSGSGDRTLIHELGHWLEDTDSKSRRAAVDLLRKRTRGASPKRLGGTYDSDEMFLPRTDGKKWMNNYMGKQYDGGDTEILSMGLEEYATNPLRLAEKDPGLFELIADIARGTLP